MFAIAYMVAFIVVGMLRIGYGILADANSTFPFALEEIERFERRQRLGNAHVQVLETIQNRPRPLTGMPVELLVGETRDDRLPVRLIRLDLPEHRLNIGIHDHAQQVFDRTLRRP